MSAEQPAPRPGAMRIRAAARSDAPLLSWLAMAAKASWGYEPAQLEDWRAELMVTADSIARSPTFVVELDREPVAMYQLDVAAAPWALEHFWVHPRAMHRGIGRAMLAHAAMQVSRAGRRALAIDADPNAEAFYLACGARRVGTVPAPTREDPLRVRPQLRLTVDLPLVARASEAGATRDEPTDR